MKRTDPRLLTLQQILADAQEKEVDNFRCFCPRVFLPSASRPGTLHLHDTRCQAGHVQTSIKQQTTETQDIQMSFWAAPIRSNACEGLISKPSDWTVCWGRRKNGTNGPMILRAFWVSRVRLRAMPTSWTRLTTTCRVVPTCTIWWRTGTPSDEGSVCESVAGSTLPRCLHRGGQVSNISHRKDYRRLDLTEGIQPMYGHFEK